MVVPLAPLAHGPITPLSPMVRVIGVLPGAEVTILQDGRPIGHATATEPGELWVPLTVQPVVGGTVTASQKTDGGTSSPSLSSVSVVDIPDPLPTPVIASELNTCMADVLVGALVPGATLRARISGLDVATTKVTADFSGLGLDPMQPIPANTGLDVWQEATIGGVLRKSAEAHSVPIAQFRLPDGEQSLPPPQIATPLQACQTSILFAEVAGGATTRVDNEGQWIEWFNPASSFTGYGGRPLRPGELTARQQMPRCRLESGVATFRVDPPADPPAPVVQHDLCPSVLRLSISNLVPGGILLLSREVKQANGSHVSIIGEAGIAYPQQSIDLPSDFQGTDPRGPVSVIVQQQLCASPPSPPCRVRLAEPGGPFPAPEIIPEVFDCVRVLRLRGAHPGSLIQASDTSSGAPISEAVVAAAPDFPLFLWFPVVAGQRVRVTQAGCNADGASDATVLPLPDPLPWLEFSAPVRPGAKHVRLRSVLPGARVHLVIDNTFGPGVECLSEDPWVPVWGAPLKERQRLMAIQVLCDRSSSPQGAVAEVTRGRMKLSVDPNKVTGGQTTQVTVKAVDAETGDDVVGQVFLNGNHAAITGTPFAVSPAVGSASLSGMVKEPTGYFDEPFSIAVAESTWTLFLTIAPATPKLDVIPYLLRQVSWTVTPSWAPQFAKTVTGVNSGANISGTASLPVPTGPNKTVTVTSSVEAETPGGQTAGWTVQPGDVPVVVGPVTVAFDGKNKKVGWLAMVDYVHNNTFLISKIKLTMMGIQDA